MSVEFLKRQFINEEMKEWVKTDQTNERSL